MHHREAIIDGLATAVTMERTLVAYYHSAAEHARHADEAEVMRVNGERHSMFSGRMNRRHEAVEKLHGEGIFREALEAIGKAFTETLAGLPVDFIHASTTPSHHMLTEMENELIAHYEKLKTTADEETSALLEAAIENGRVCRAAVERISQ